ncbi:MAG: ATP-dependent zinc metalloprotease FtsH [Gammaproteobacteria bacterium]|nr:MAG: ATP-dependent zinc metalloprotease FtsH [Gammaproteobacteria bacterium]
MLGLALWAAREAAPPAPEADYSAFKAELAAGRVEAVELQGHALLFTLREPRALPPGRRPAARYRTWVPVVGDPALLPALERAGVALRVRPPPAGPGWSELLLGLLPWLLLGLLFWWGLRQAAGEGRLGPGSELGRFLRATVREAKVPEVRFADVAGQRQAKREVQEIVDFLRRPEDFRRLGAEIPRGVLLVGPPGTGKTLLARALAGEAGVPFYSISGSEFIEVFVGVGASRVRHLFQAAKEHAPAIVFIDELDSVGRTRGTGLGGGHDEREQTLNQILAEMDGFEGHEAVIVLAATNRPDVLDPALLRPGRFDRQVTLDLPDRPDRLELLRLHTRRVPLAEDVDLERLAAGTAGFSGADIRNLVNEAAVLAARERAARVTMGHFEEARDKVTLGVPRALDLRPAERRRLAVHEAGHATAAHLLPTTDPLYKVSIIPRGRALGVTQQLPEEEHHTLPEDYLRERLVVMLAGRAAERELLGTVSSGADDDIQQATRLARAMVSRWGMDERIGPVDLRQSEDHPFLGREIAQPRRYSEHAARAVDEGVRRLLLEAEGRARALLAEHREGVERLVEALLERETLHREEVAACLGPPGGQG